MNEIRDCAQCEYHKGMSNPAKGVKIPGGYGREGIAILVK